MNKAPLIGISRFRMGTDGHGITTLVAFHGCPLRCEYCLNPECNDPEGIKISLSPEELYKIVLKDELYFRATKGGLTFGGGEPLLHSQFIKEVLELGAKNWNVTIESSLNVQREHLERLLPYVNQYIVDIKDMSPGTYNWYTTKTNDLVVENLKWLAEQGKVDSVILRVPLIYRYNNEQNQNESVEILKQMGFTHFDMFKYKTDKRLLSRIKRRINDKISRITRLRGAVYEDD